MSPSCSAFRTGWRFVRISICFDRCSWVRKFDTHTVNGRAVGGGNVGDKHGRKVRSCPLGELRDAIFLGLVAGGLTLRSTTSDFDGSAVHVHLAVPDLVEPGPGECVRTRSDALRDSVLIFVGASTIWVLREIASRTPSWTASDDRVNNHPFRILGSWAVGSEGDLARATAMDSRAFERKCLLLANSHIRDRSPRASSTLARKVGARCFERAAVGVAIGRWCEHDHVGVRGGQESQGRGGENGFERRHVAVWSASASYRTK